MFLNPYIFANIFALCKYAILWRGGGLMQSVRNRIFECLYKIDEFNMNGSNMVEAVPTTKFIEFMERGSDQ